MVTQASLALGEQKSVAAAQMPLRVAAPARTMQKPFAPIAERPAADLPRGSLLDLSI